MVLQLSMRHLTKNSKTKIFSHVTDFSGLDFRHIFSVSGSWDPELTHGTKKEIEVYWKDKINATYHAEEEKPKYYLLSMFPYPSGRLHMGHVRVYTISDAIARFQRMRGKRVIHPIGWDAFGLPAENAAIDKNVHPAEWTANNINTMREQLKSLNISFDWDMELSTCDPSYYKWTQYIFLLMYEKGLAYKKQAVVNWDPIDQTVLADEQVDENGCSWRSGCKVEKRKLTQWFLRTTAFAKDLYDGLNNPDLVEWRDAVKIQQNWIGACTGYTFQLKVFHNGVQLDTPLAVWTDVPELLYGARFVAISPENNFNCVELGGGQLGDQKLKIEAVHPITDELMPIFVTDSLDHSPATDSFLGIPGSPGEECLNFAIKHQLEVVPVVDSDSNTLQNSGEFTGMDLKEAKEKIINTIKQLDIDVYQTSKQLRDWLISRQRYWGTPIPIINCPTCKSVPVPKEDLPVVLPHITEFSGKSVSLKMAEEWLNVKCPRCGGMASRDTDTMDTFVDSSWYFLRFLDVHNSLEPFDKEKVKTLMPVDLYIGGKEHAALHLFYARFLAHFCHRLGMLEGPEPFLQLLMQGMIHGKSFKVQQTGKYIRKEDVDFSGSEPVEKQSGSLVVVDWEKMSKSKFNGIDPETVLTEHGIDTTRLFILGNVAPQSPRKWNDELFPGIWKWQRRIWLTITDFLEQRKRTDEVQDLNKMDVLKYESDLYSAKNYYIKGTTHNFINTRQLSVAISKLQGLTGELRKLPKSLAKDNSAYEDTLAALIIMLAPLAPHFASELWTAFCTAAAGGSNYDLTKPVFHQKWPEIDMDFNMKIIIKLNGEEYDSIPIPRRELETLTEEKAIQLALNSEKLQKKLNNIKVKHMQYKPRPDYDGEVNVIFITEKKKSKSVKPKKNKEMKM